MTWMKKIFSVIILLSVVASFAFCGEAKPSDTIALFIRSAKNADAESLDGCVFSSSWVEDYKSLVSGADADAVAALRRIYANIEYTVISENVERDEAGDDIVITDTSKQTVRINIKYPDFETIMSRTDGEARILPGTKLQILNSLFSNDNLGAYMLESVMDIVLTKDGGAWKIKLSQTSNRELYGALELAEFARWISK